MESYKLEDDNVLRFITAGKSEFSIKNEVTGTHYTYKVMKARNPQRDSKAVFFIRVCYEYLNFQYAGCLIIGQDNSITYSKGVTGKIDSDAPSIKGLLWLFDKAVHNKPIDKRMGIYHFGRCARCGKVLTDPESVRIGLGPDCRRH